MSIESRSRGERTVTLTETEVADALETCRSIAILDTYRGLLNHDGWLTDVGRTAIEFYVQHHENEHQDITSNDDKEVR
jgi:hypothetical protein